MTTWRERARERRENRLRGEELAEAVEEAAQRLFVGGPASPIPTDQEVEEAAAALFGENRKPGGGRLSEGGRR